MILVLIKLYLRQFCKVVTFSQKKYSSVFLRVTLLFKKIIILNFKRIRSFWFKKIINGRRISFVIILVQILFLRYFRTGNEVISGCQFRRV